MILDGRKKLLGMKGITILFDAYLIDIRSLSTIRYILTALLNNEEMYRDIRNNMGGAAITRLTIAKLNAIKVIMPPIELQNQFADLYKQTDKSKAAVQAALDKAQLLFDSLMQEYFG